MCETISEANPNGSRNSVATLHPSLPQTRIDSAIAKVGIAYLPSKDDVIHHDHGSCIESTENHKQSGVIIMLALTALR